MPHDQPVLPVVTPGGHHFELIEVRAEQPRGSLLFAPGLGMSARLYIAFAQALAQRQISVYLHEWRGNGSSSLRASRRQNWGYAELLADLHAARQVVAAHGPSRFLLGGHSLGGQLTALSAAADAQGLIGLINLAGGSPFWRNYRGRNRLLTAFAMYAFPALGMVRGHYPGRRLGFGGNEARGVMRDWGRSARSGRYQPRGVKSDLEAGLAALQLPALAIALEEDWLVPAASLDWLTGKLKASPLTRQTVRSEDQGAAADHYAWMRQPEKCAELIAHWAASLEPAAGKSENDARVQEAGG